MDFVTDLPSIHGYNSMFVVVDHFSKAMIIAPCWKDITAEQTSKLYLEQVWRRTGLPQQVISDHGPQVMRKLWDKLGVKASLSTAFHPQTDGETEHINQEIKQLF